MRSTRRRPAGGVAGFSYVGLLVLVAILGLLVAAGLKAGAILQRQAAERELLYIGGQFADALKSYADATPSGGFTQPPSLKDLLLDPRFSVPKRHLRKLYVDPIIGNSDWGITYRSDKVGVLAIYSKSAAKPFKTGNFDPRFAAFENKAHLYDWKFTIAAARVKR